MKKANLQGLVAATHTPFHEDGSLNLAVVDTQAEHLLANGVRYAFIGGTTGESSSLTCEERSALAERWLAVSKDSALKVIVHVGSNCLADSRTLAAQAQRLGALAISAVAPSYFKPPTASVLIDCMADIAAAAPDLPFYYYEIPTMTGISVSPSEVLAQAAERIPNLAGIKFTSSNLMELQLCRACHGGDFDVAFGSDEMLLAALSLGVTAAVGSTYNFAAPIYTRLMADFEKGDLHAARIEQLRAVRLVQALVPHGFMGAAKATMKMLGVNVGPARLPNRTLTSDQQATLRQTLESMGFFKWIKP